MEDGTDETDPTAATVLHIKFVAYSVVAYIIVGLGLVGNLLNLVVLTRPNLTLSNFPLSEPNFLLRWVSFSEPNLLSFSEK